MNQSELLRRSSQVLIENYGRLPYAMVRGEGVRIWDADGTEYLDFFAGFGGAGVAGHCHPKITQALESQAGALCAHGNLFTNEPQVDLAERITRNGFGGKVFFCHSGGEANEAAIKLVRLAVGEGRHKIISFHNCFHGRTMGGLSLTPENFQKGFGPMLPGNVKATMGDIDSVRNAIDGETAGVFIEPIQGEGGMNVPTREFMTQLRRLCDKRDLLLVADEVWTAPARTGQWFAYQHFGIEPDVMTLAKAVGGGAPVGAMVAAEKVADVLTPGAHGCTMGGNPLCAAAGAACMKLIEEEDLVPRARTLGEQVTAQLRDANLPGVEDVRGAGLMIGLQLAEDRPAKEIMLAAMDAGLIVCVAKNNVLRLAPPLITPEEDLSAGLEVLMRVMR